MVLAEQRVHLLKSESQRFVDYLSGLPEESLAQQSACERWLVGDVVAHLTGGVDNYFGNITRGVAGDSSPPEGGAPSGPSDAAARLVANAQRAVALREQLGKELLPTFASRCRDLDQLLAGLGNQDWEKPCFHNAAIISVATYVDLRITEVIVHEWDIKSRLQAAASISPAGLPAVWDLLPVFVVGRLFQPGSTLSSPARYRWDLTGDAPGAHDIVVEEGKARMEPAGSTGTTAPDVTFTCDAGDFALLAYGRTDFETAISAGLITAEGDSELAAAFAP